MRFPCMGLKLFMEIFIILFYELLELTTGILLDLTTLLENQNITKQPSFIKPLITTFSLNAFTHSDKKCNPIPSLGLRQRIYISKYSIFVIYERLSATVR